MVWQEEDVGARPAQETVGPVGESTQSTRGFRVLKFSQLLE